MKLKFFILDSNNTLNHSSELIQPSTAINNSLKTALHHKFELNECVYAFFWLNNSFLSYATWFGSPVIHLRGKLGRYMPQSPNWTIFYKCFKDKNITFKEELKVDCILSNESTFLLKLQMPSCGHLILDFEIPGDIFIFR